MLYARLITLVEWSVVLFSHEHSVISEVRFAIDEDCHAG